MRRVVLCLILLPVLQPVHAQTPTWTKLATTSGTLTPGSVCTTDGTDITCTQSLSGLQSPDRITSGTAGIFVSDTGIINLRTGGTTTGYFDTSGLLVTPGISLTTANGISSTNGSFNGTVNIYAGPSIPDQNAIVTFRRSSGNIIGYLYGSGGNGMLRMQHEGGNTFAELGARNGSSAMTLQRHSPTNSARLSFFTSNTTQVWYMGYKNNWPDYLVIENGTRTLMVFSPSQTVGINLTSPTTPLEVSGTVSATTLRLSAASPCATAADAGNHRMAGGVMQVCRVE